MAWCAADFRAIQPRQLGDAMLYDPNLECFLAKHPSDLGLD
jgi:hypothetical protein